MAFGCDSREVHRLLLVLGLEYLKYKRRGSWRLSVLKKGPRSRRELYFYCQLALLTNTRYCRLGARFLVDRSSPIDDGVLRGQSILQAP